MAVAEGGGFFGGAFGGGFFDGRGIGGALNGTWSRPAGGGGLPLGSGLGWEGKSVPSIAMPADRLIAPPATASARPPAPWTTVTSRHALKRGRKRNSAMSKLGAQKHDTV